MSKFDELKRPGTCDVCGKETDIAVCASGYGPISLSYCKDCLENGYEPYNILVAYISGATDNYPDGINKKHIDEIKGQLSFHNKTEEQFKADCKKANEIDKQVKN